VLMLIRVLLVEWMWLRVRPLNRSSKRFDTIVLDFLACLGVASDDFDAQSSKRLQAT
jgi:hypothetical protein